MISASCACGKSLRVKDELAGFKVRCPACSQPLTIPAAEPEDSFDPWHNLPEQADETAEADEEENVPSPRLKKTWKTGKTAGTRSDRGLIATAGLTIKKIFGGLSILIGGLLALGMVFLFVTGKGEIRMLRGLFLPVVMIGMGVAWVKGETYGD